MACSGVPMTYVTVTTATTHTPEAEGLWVLSCITMVIMVMVMVMVMLTARNRFPNSLYIQTPDQPVLAAAVLLKFRK